MASLGVGNELPWCWKHIRPLNKTTYFRGQNKLNRGANQVILQGKITCFEKPHE